MFPRIQFNRFLKSDWFIAAGLLVVFLLTNGYTYAWDDQHLEIPLLKSLINPLLYAGDYYVESLKINFTSYLYPLLARVISIKQIPAAFLALYLVSRYFLLFWIYKLWRLISKEKFTALCCTLMIMIVGRVEEFLYRTFSHQEFALAIIMAGIYFFYKERFLLAAAILGIAANFHALYSLYPFGYMGLYLLWQHKKHGMKTFFRANAVFAVAILPLAIWIFRKHGWAGPPLDPGISKNWIPLYHLACPQNFIFYDKSVREVMGSLKTFLDVTRGYWILISFTLVNLAYNRDFRQDKKTHAVILAGAGLMLFSFIFSQIIPVRFIVDLNLIRNMQYILFFLMGYTVILLKNINRNEKWWIALICFLFYPLIRFGYFIAPLAGFGMLSWLGFANARSRQSKIKKLIFGLLCTAGFLAAGYGIIIQFQAHRYSGLSLMCLYIILGLYLILFIGPAVLKNRKLASGARTLALILPFVLFGINYVYYHKRHLAIERTGTGFWQLQRNWIDMQNYVREHTEENALLLVPYDMEMGGFRILSERKIVMSYRDCGIIGFDYAAAVEWQKRLKDIEEFQVIVTRPFSEALKKAIFQYHINYVVFMRYADPGENAILKPLYKNDAFALYKVLINSVNQNN